MLQGGDPTGTGRGGESIYGGKFEDEITNALKHTGKYKTITIHPSIHVHTYIHTYI